MDKRIIATVLCITFCYFGFTYDSGWAFFGSILCLFTALD